MRKTENLPTPRPRSLCRTLHRAVLPALLSATAGGYLAVALLFNVGDATPARANTTTVLYWLPAPGNDAFWNFDFRDENVASNGVDWPLRFLFRNNAEIDAVKIRLKGCVSPIIFPSTCSSGSEKHARFNDNGYPQWDGDGGIKESNNCSTGAQHMRLYANPPSVYPYDRNYNGTWGYYLFASVHKDYEGGTTGSCTTYYSAEGEESWWIQRVLENLTNWGWSVVSNSYDWSNPDSGHWDLVDDKWHWTQSNGYATFVSVSGQ